MFVGGRRVDVNSPSLALQSGVATIYQENSLFQYLSVAENIFLGDELRRLPGVVDSRAMLASAQSILDRLGASIDVGAVVSSLGGAGQKIVEIARAFRRNARILVMDEPSASFSQHETRLLFRAVREMAASGAGVIFISHHLEEVFEIADRVTTLRDGRLVSTRAMAETTVAGLIRDMVGRDVDQVTGGCRKRQDRSPSKPAACAAQVSATSTSPCVAAKWSGSPVWSAPGAPNCSRPFSGAIR